MSDHPLLRVVISAPLVRVKSSRCSGDIRLLPSAVYKKAAAHNTQRLACKSFVA
jgi:hypothetical protein